MKKILLVLLVLGVAAAIAYLLSTEDGRARRDAIVARVRKQADHGPEIDLTEAADKVEDAATKVAEEVGNAVDASG
jgi:hypothetical protein